MITRTEKTKRHNRHTRKESEAVGRASHGGETRSDAWG